MPWGKRERTKSVSVSPSNGSNPSSLSLHVHVFGWEGRVVKRSLWVSIPYVFPPPFRFLRETIKMS